MKSLSMEEFTTLVNEVVEISSSFIGKHVAASIVQHVLETVQHGAMRRERARDEVTGWLKLGHSLSSWLSYNKDMELALSLEWPELYQLMLAQEAATAKLKAAEKAVCNEA